MSGYKVCIVYQSSPLSSQLELDLEHSEYIWSGSVNNK